MTIKNVHDVDWMFLQVKTKQLIIYHKRIAVGTGILSDLFRRGIQSISPILQQQKKVQS